VYGSRSFAVLGQLPCLLSLNEPVPIKKIKNKKTIPSPSQGNFDVERRGDVDRNVSYFAKQLSHHVTQGCLVPSIIKFN
jgi:hypothetical protein